MTEASEHRRVGCASRTTRIVGIDPGSRITGYGIIDFRDNRSVHVASGGIRVRGDSLAGRLHHIFQALGEVVEAHLPDQMAVEQVFMHRNADSALKLGQARGAAMLVGTTHDLTVYEYSPNQIKQAITGRGHADKTQVQHMIKVLLCLGESPAADAADALAVAICHGHIHETTSRMQRAAARGEARS